MTKKSSRILKRNQRGFVQEVDCGDTNPIPATTDPMNPNWEWPRWVNNPMRYANYVERLHRLAGLEMKYPKGAFMRFASTHWEDGRERLVRAACVAAQRARHPFSPKFIKQFIDEVPFSGVIVKDLF